MHGVGQQSQKQETEGASAGYMQAEVNSEI